MADETNASGPAHDRAAHNEALWERNAEWWQRTFSAGADAEYEDQILPLIARHLQGAGRVLDVGCGEGQVSRRIAESGAEVVGLDPTTAQVRAARDRAGGPRYSRARAEALPCRGDAFDAVVVCLALEHVDDFETAIREVARVLAPGGVFVLLLSHPLLQAPGSGWIVDETNGERFWRVGAYLTDDIAVDNVAPGVDFLFIHRPLGRYVRAIAGAGLFVRDLEEPAPTARFLAEYSDFPEAATIPRLLLVRAVKPPTRTRPLDM